MPGTLFVRRDPLSRGVGERVRWGVHGTPVGPAFVAASEQGLLAFEFVAAEGSLEASAARFPEAWALADWTHDPEGTAPLAARAFDPGATPPPLHVVGTDFQRTVWKALLEIPFGGRVTYGELATRLGRPGAARAIGGAVGANRIGIWIPCHRVVPSAGMGRGGRAVGGYRWGAGVKAALLDWEASVGDAVPSALRTRGATSVP
jgi:AraC family transcriptional regulator, regulatory protein of adaptative response / methylated-DNA-[protein]-cysteine methyltransferase